MATAEKHYLTEAEYLAIERAAPFKSEYFRGEMFAMAGSSYPHNRIKDNTILKLGTQFQGGPCFTLSSDQRVKVMSTRLYVYPDIAIVCGQPEFEDNSLDTLLNPRVIFEILSESTEAYDRGNKFKHYRELPSLQEYVLVSQTQPMVERYLRKPDGDWVLTEFSGLEAVLELRTVEARIPLTAIYAGIEMSETGGQMRPMGP